MLTDQSLKIPKQYKCEKCYYITCNKKDFNKHLSILYVFRLINVY